LADQLADQRVTVSEQRAANFRPKSLLSTFSKREFNIRESSFACHSEGATRSGSMTEWKIFSKIPIETPATEESLASSRL